MKTTFCILFTALGISTFLFASEFFHYGHDEIKTGIVISDGAAEEDAEEEYRMTNKIEIIKFRPKVSYLESGDIHCVVDFFVQISQISTNFYSYEFARNPRNQSLKKIKLVFTDDHGNEVLTIPCVDEGHDMVWGMDGIRLVQLHGSFILTYGRCDYLKSNAKRFYFVDQVGNLLSDDGYAIMGDITQKERFDLIEHPYALMRGKSK